MKDKFYEYLEKGDSKTIREGLRSIYEPEELDKAIDKMYYGYTNKEDNKGDFSRVKYQRGSSREMYKKFLGLDKSSS